jgi:hypothetical protein
MIAASAPDFWRLWYVGLIVATVRWLETIAVGVVVYQRTDSAFLVSMMTMLRLLPMGLFGVFLGALAERFDRGRTLLVVVLVMSATSTVLASGPTGQLQVWHLASPASSTAALEHRQPGAPRDDGEVGAAGRWAPMSLDVGAGNASPWLARPRRFLPAGMGIRRFYAGRAAVLHRALGGSDIRSRIPRAAAPARCWRGSPRAVLVRTDRGLIGVLVVTVIHNVFAWPHQRDSRHRATACIWAQGVGCWRP